MVDYCHVARCIVECSDFGCIRMAAIGAGLNLMLRLCPIALNTVHGRICASHDGIADSCRMTRSIVECSDLFLISRWLQSELLGVILKGVGWVSPL